MNGNPKMCLSPHDKIDFPLFFLFKCLFIYLFLAVLGLGCCGQAFFNCDRQGLLSIAEDNFSLWWLLLFQSMALGYVGLSGCSTWAQQLCHGHVGSSRTRDQTCVPCTGKQTLVHYITRKVFFLSFILSLSLSLFLIFVSAFQTNITDP